MRIHLFNEYFLDRYDELNYVIMKRRIKKKSGSITYDNIGFHSNLKSLSVSIKEKYVKANIFNEDFESILNMLDELDDRVRSFEDE